MESFKFREIKMKKSNAASRRPWPRTVRIAFFKLIEISVVLIYICKVIADLPDWVKNSGKHLKDWTFLVMRPRFVFFLANAIIITLFVKSGQMYGPDREDKCTGNDLYQEFIEKSRSQQRIQQDDTKNGAEQSTDESSKQSVIEGIEQRSITENRGELSIIRSTAKQSISEKRVKERTSENRARQSISEKRVKQSISQKRAQQSISETRGKQSISENRIKQIVDENKGKQNTVERADQDVLETDRYRRTQSEHSRHEAFGVSSSPKLTRSETESFTKACDSDKRIIRLSYPEDHMSNDEFRNKIEAFIARQRRFQQVED